MFSIAPGLARFQTNSDEIDIESWENSVNDIYYVTYLTVRGAAGGIVSEYGSNSTTTKLCIAWAICKNLLAGIKHFYSLTF
jgi:hypothetical protein